MDSMEKVSAVRTVRYNEFPRPLVQQRRQAKPVWFFEEGSGDLTELLGGKGAGLAEMTRAGLPVPPGFTITTDVCREYYANDRRFPGGLLEDVRVAMHELEARTGKTFGHGPEPAARLRPERRACLDARHDGHDPEPRPERRDGRSRSRG